MTLVILLAAGLALAVLLAVAQCAWMLTHPPKRGYAFAVSKSVPGTPLELPPVMGGPHEFREWTHRVWESGSSTHGTLTRGPRQLDLAVWGNPGAQSRRTCRGSYAWLG